MVVVVVVSDEVQLVATDVRSSDVMVQQTEMTVAGLITAEGKLSHC